MKCPGLEHAGAKQHGRHFDHLVAACGARLNHTWHYRDGGWVHASDLFNTAYSARDVAGVLRALRLGRVDLYGDSYGSWFAQVFASRYPGRLRSVTLDSTYQVLGLDPWYTTTVLTARRAFAQACERSAACAAATRGGRAWARIGALARRLARRPVSGPTTSASGTPGRLTVTPLTLVNLVNNAGFDPVVYQDLDAAARALLQRDDAAPLLRLAALSLGFDDTNESLPGFSDGLYFAVSCTDYVQLFDRSAPPSVRHRQYRAALRREPAGTFAPFSLAQWTSMDQYTEAYSACLDWPAPVHHNRPITRRPPLVPARLPVLILSGSLDSLTPRLDGATLVARQMGRSARLVTLANLTHVTEQDGDSGCAMSIYQRFVSDPGGLPDENTSCAGRVSPIHTVGSYPRRLADAVPASPRPGNQAGRQALRAATVALASVGDEVSRWPLLSGNRDLGLRGGRVAFSGGTDLKITLRGVRWVRGAVIDGTAVWDQSSGLGDRPAYRAPGRRRGGPADRPMAGVRPAAAARGSPRLPGRPPSGRAVPGTLTAGSSWRRARHQRDAAKRRSTAAPASGSAGRSSLRELIPSFPSTLPRCHSSVRGLRNSRAPISGFVCPPAARRATWASCGVSSSSVSTVRLRTVSPVASSSRRARSANASMPMSESIVYATRSCSRASNATVLAARPFAVQKVGTWVTVQTSPLTRHPSDPVTART